jgi:hypothetical protein
MTEPSRLAVLVDGALLDAEAARALWTEFSAHMDVHQGDMKGFARKKGWQSVAPEFRQGKATLVVQTGAAAPRPPPAKAKPKPTADRGAPGNGKGRGKPRR